MRERTNGLVGEKGKVERKGTRLLWPVIKYSSISRLSLATFLIRNVTYVRTLWSKLEIGIMLTLSHL